MPIVQAFRKIHQEKLITKIFYTLLSLVAVVLMIEACVPSASLPFIRKYHLRQKPFAKWAALHFIPSLYSFSNEVWYSPVHSAKETVEGKTPFNPKTAWHGYYNHYPLRMITFTLDRKTFFRDVPTQYFSIRSSYKNTQLSTHFLLRQKNGELFITNESF